jgi:hypothetical protein
VCLPFSMGVARTAILLLCLLLPFSLLSNPVDDFEDDFEDQFVTAPTPTPSPFPAQSTFVKPQVVVDSVARELEYDDDEFILPRSRPAADATKEKKAAVSEPKKAAVLLPWAQEFAYDLFLASLIFAHAVIFFVGSSTNSSTATKFGREFASLFKANFEYFGGAEAGRLTPVASATESDIVTSLSRSEYLIAAAGHRSCVGLSLYLNLVARQDSISWLYDVFVGKEGDEVVLEFAMSELDSYNCLIIRKPLRENYTSTYNDVTSSPFVHDCQELGSDFCVVSDADRFIESHLFSQPDVASALIKYRHLVKSLHFTNQETKSTHKCIMRFIFKLPEVPEELTTLMKMSIFLMDFMSRLRLSAAARQGVEKRREQLLISEKKEKRQEALQQKKEKEWSTLTDEQKKKRLEREKMRKIKKRVSAMKIQVG